MATSSRRVLGGVGLALLPTFLAGDDLRNGRLVSVPRVSAEDLRSMRSTARPPFVAEGARLRGFSGDGRPAPPWDVAP